MVREDCPKIAYCNETCQANDFDPNECVHCTDTATINSIYCGLTECESIAGKPRRRRKPGKKRGKKKKMGKGKKAAVSGGKKVAISKAKAFAKSDKGKAVMAKGLGAAKKAFGM